MSFEGESNITDLKEYKIMKSHALKAAASFVRDTGDVEQAKAIRREARATLRGKRARKLRRRRNKVITPKWR